MKKGKRSSYFQTLLLFLTIIFMFSNITYSYSWIQYLRWYNSSMPIVYHINLTTHSSVIPAGAASAIEAAFNTWQNASTISSYNWLSFQRGEDTSITPGTLYDGINTLGWGDTYGDEAFTVLDTRNGDGNPPIIEADIVFNWLNYYWATNGQSNALDVQNVATHEIGHWLGLGDLYGSGDEEKTMYGYGGLGETKKRTLDNDDKWGIYEIYHQLLVPIQYPNIQSAIDAAVTGQTIRIGSGTYNDNITINGSTKNGITIQGQGTNNTIIYGTITATNTSNLHISDLKLQSGGLSLNNCSTFNFLNLDTYQCSTSTLAFYGSTGQIYGSISLNSSAGIYCNDTDCYVVEGSEITSEGIGVWLQNTSLGNLDGIELCNNTWDIYTDGTSYGYGDNSAYSGNPAIQPMEM